ncbi:MAG: hypothetical protein EOM23_10825, partial [Candidatus Moranbacteria bacterium]|nr:hypothetical protein [Candidatus Moranbacteria bacterium]
MATGSEVGVNAFDNLNITETLLHELIHALHFKMNDPMKLMEWLEGLHEVIAQDGDPEVMRSFQDFMKELNKYSYEKFLVQNVLDGKISREQAKELLGRYRLIYNKLEFRHNLDFAFGVGLKRSSKAPDQDGLEEEAKKLYLFYRWKFMTGEISEELSMADCLQRVQQGEKVIGEQLGMVFASNQSFPSGIKPLDFEVPDDELRDYLENFPNNVESMSTEGWAWLIGKLIHPGQDDSRAIDVKANVFANRIRDRPEILRYVIKIFWAHFNNGHVSDGNAARDVIVGLIMQKPDIAPYLQSIIEDPEGNSKNSKEVDDSDEAMLSESEKA